MKADGETFQRITEFEQVSKHRDSDLFHKLSPVITTRPSCSVAAAFRADRKQRTFWHESRLSCKKKKKKTFSAAVSASSSCPPQPSCPRSFCIVLIFIVVNILCLSNSHHLSKSESSTGGRIPLTHTLIDNYRQKSFKHSSVTRHRIVVEEFNLGNLFSPRILLNLKPISIGTK